jgi:membrane peptidoglycan carboxypeptidase
MGPPGTPPRGNPPGNPADQATDMLTPLHARGRVAPEPDLLTHREFGDEGYDDPDSLYDEEPIESDEEARRKRRKKMWRRIRRISYVFLAVLMIGPIIAFFIMYQMVDVPDPNALAQKLPKTVTVKWANGDVMTTVAPQGKRTLVTYDQIPEYVLNAVYAAEDNTFRTNSGFDLTGILRAVWNNITGGTGGGSTITQQYVKKATEDEEKTLTRKATEVVKAYKMSNTMNKEDIITAYLNTIYFGRGANGIAEAAKQYFGKATLKELTPNEAALLAGVIQSPNRALKDPSYLETRWNYVMDKLVENKWMSAADRKAAQFPALVEQDSQNTKLTPDQRLIWEAARRELDNANIPPEQIEKAGYTVELTVDPVAQQMAGEAVEAVMNGQPENLRQALVAVDPNTGRVIAYYGYNKARSGLDYAGQVWQNPGSSFKPFDLVALLHQNKGLGEVYDGSSPRKFGGSTISNSENNNKCQQCTVAKAMELSINTVFADIAFTTVGTKAVARAAIESGIPANVGAKGLPLEGTGGNPPNVNIAIGGDVYQARPVDMAGAYATFAANGTKRTPHLVSKVIDPNNNNTVIYDGDQQAGSKAAFDADPGNNAKIARNVTESLLPIPKSSNVPCDGDRQCAGKTGTHGCDAVPGKTTKADNCAAWMVGYTPQVSTSVWVGSDDNSAIKNNKNKIIFGSGLPGQVWQKFMNSYLKGKDKVQFPNYVPIGKSVEDAAKSSAASAAAENSKTQQQSTTSTTSSSQQSQTSTSQPTSTTSTTKTGGGPPGPGPGGPGPGGPTIGSTRDNLFLGG